MDSGRFIIGTTILIWALTLLTPISLLSFHAGLDAPSADHDIKARSIPFMFQIIGLFLVSFLFSLVSTLLVNTSMGSHHQANQQFLATQAKVKRAIRTVVLYFLASSLLQVKT